jgi:hypothetical protein
MLTLSAASAEETREDGEDALSAVVDRALRSFLAQVERESVGPVLEGSTPSTSSLAAAAFPEPSPELPTLGEVTGWWAAVVNEEISEEVYRVYRASYHDARDGVITAHSLDRADSYLASVRDRLVRGITPPIQEDAFDKVRVSISQGLAEGWSREQTAQRIAAELAWETDGPYWRSEKARYEASIAAILDPLGPPGSSARESARLLDPTVAALQAQRTEAVLHLDAEEAYWQTRANRISRTESTGATNYGSLNALADEGWTRKKWVSTGDARTRDSHRSAAGQERALASPFSVGGYSLMIPGDPSGPAKEVINCRCTVVGAGQHADTAPLLDLL